MTVPHHPETTPDRWLPRSVCRRGLAGLGVPAPGRVQSPLLSAPHPLLGPALAPTAPWGWDVLPPSKAYFLPTL